MDRAPTTATFRLFSWHREGCVRLYRKSEYAGETKSQGGVVATASSTMVRADELWLGFFGGREEN
jgi:hypothetical protein